MKDLYTRFAISLAVATLLGCASQPANDPFTGNYRLAGEEDPTIYTVSKMGDGWSLAMSKKADAPKTIRSEDDRKAQLYRVDPSQLLRVDRSVPIPPVCIATLSSPGEGTHQLLPYFALCRVPRGSLVVLAKPIPEWKEFRATSEHVLIFGLMGATNGVELEAFR